VRLIADADKLSGDAYAAPFAPDGAFHNVIDSQFPADLVDRFRGALVLHGGRARNHAKALRRDVADLRDQFVREAVREVLLLLIPAEILYRKKMGFPTPLTAWFRDPKAEPFWQALSARDGFIASYLDLDSVKSLIERQRGGFEDATDRLWRLLNLQIWGDVFITGREERWREDRLVSKSAALEA